MTQSEVKFLDSEDFTSFIVGIECHLADHANINPSGVRTVTLIAASPQMQLVEVVRTEALSNEIVEILLGICKRLGKTSVSCKDTPG
jgi:3-hydroxyacyl-CoA dehydrogenase, NAD binding domain